MTRYLSALLLTAALPAMAEEPRFTTGPAREINAGLIDCGRGSRVSAVGEIASDDGTVWTVPAATSFATAPKAMDLFNECGGVELGGLSDLDLADVPVLQAGGSEEFTMFVFADNYFELFVNGALLAVDPVPFTPFNSNVVRFRADRPVTIAVMAVDWEENLGLGSERGRGADYQPGDGGVVAQVRDAAGAPVLITDQSWKVQTFYTGPLKDRACLVVDGAMRDSSACDAAGSNDATGYSMAHWAIPQGWASSAFDDSGWPAARVYSNETVGVDGKDGFTSFTDVFDAEGADAEFIWSSNLLLDNLVLMRGRLE
ncbi:MAG: hypothetical protein ACRC14_06240 [Paracoccaceae bacterium]